MPSEGVPSVIGACNDLLTFKCFVHGTPIALGVDTGASCNLISEKAYNQLKDLYNLHLLPANTSLHSVQGTTLNVVGTVTLPLCLDVKSPILQVTFFVTSGFALHCDGLLGLESLMMHNIDVFPQKRAISLNGTHFAVIN